MSRSPVAVLVLALGLLAGCGGETAPRPEPTAQSPTTPATSPTPSDHAEESSPDLAGTWPPKPLDHLGVGETFISDDGTGTSAGLVSHDGATWLRVESGPATSEARLPAGDQDAFLLDIQLELGQTGAGWVVGRERATSIDYDVYVVRDGRLVRAVESGRPALGIGSTPSGRERETWFTEFGYAYTRVATGQRAQQFRLYSWAVSGPGEGGGTPVDPTPRLRAEPVGVVCLLDNGTETVVQHC